MNACFEIYKVRMCLQECSRTTTEKERKLCVIRYGISATGTRTVLFENENNKSSITCNQPTTQLNAANIKLCGGDDKN